MTASPRLDKWDLAAVALSRIRDRAMTRSVVLVLFMLLLAGYIEGSITPLVFDRINATAAAG